MYPDLLFQMAITRIPHIGDVRAKVLIEEFGDAESVFKAKPQQIEKVEGIGSVVATSIKHFSDFKVCEAEIDFIKKSGITPLFVTDEKYPKRLLNCADNPLLLYYKGTADLNQSKIVSIVGTRNNSEYGRSICEKFIAALQDENILVVSGLAFGIDTIAHKAAVKNKVETVGAVAHGLDKIYPAQNKNLAKEMIGHGGLLTHFMSGTNPDRQNFPSRNRIVAGICDALVVIESSDKGGSLITADLANGYNKDVFAFPGRTTDSKSEGCNALIKNNKALLITNAEDLLQIMNWQDTPKHIPKQRELFIELTGDEKKVTDILCAQETIHIDELYFKSGLSGSAAASALLMLEMKGVVCSMPGKMYRLI